MVWKAFVNCPGFESLSRVILKSNSQNKAALGLESQAGLFFWG